MSTGYLMNYCCFANNFDTVSALYRLRRGPMGSSRTLGVPPPGESVESSEGRRNYQRGDDNSLGQEIYCLRVDLLGNQILQFPWWH